jgi:hypothetical protein
VAKILMARYWLLTWWSIELILTNFQMILYL